jgi:sulfur carrier protein
MELTVSGDKKTYPEGLTVAQLLDLEKVETPQYVTVSVNDEFVLSEAVNETILHAGDEVEFLYYMGGGC